MNLISKKELLAMTGISYGQLYRWKREKLIPEEWFIKKSSYTGQETFFPREQILSRVQSILDAKGQYSLEELAEMLAPEQKQYGLPREKLAQITEVNANIAKLALEMVKKNIFLLEEVVVLAGVSGAAQAGKLSPAETAVLLTRCLSLLQRLERIETQLVIFRADHNLHAAFYYSTLPILFDKDITVLDTTEISSTIAQFHVKYKHLLK